MKTLYPKKSYSRGDNMNKLIRAPYLAKHFKNKIIIEPDLKIRTLKAQCRSELGVEVNTSVCKNAKAAIMRKIMRYYVEEFGRLWDYVGEIKKSNR